MLSGWNIPILTSPFSKMILILSCEGGKILEFVHFIEKIGSFPLLICTV
nr:MAG TPA: hypothetical protein [Caudoviricetes sp.]